MKAIGLLQLCNCLNSLQHHGQAQQQGHLYCCAFQGLLATISNYRCARSHHHRRRHQHIMQDMLNALTLININSYYKGYSE